MECQEGENVAEKESEGRIWRGGESAGRVRSGWKTSRKRKEWNESRDGKAEGRGEESVGRVKNNRENRERVKWVNRECFTGRVRSGGRV